MSPRTARRRAPLLALVAAIAAVAAASRDDTTLALDGAGVAVSAAAAHVPAAPRAAEAAPLLPPRSAASAGEPPDLFESRTWQPAPPPQTTPRETEAPPPAPTAPPLPFVYLGQYQEADQPVVFLVRGDRVLPVRRGDVVEGEYRVDEISGDTLVLTYLPLNVKQTLHMGQAG